MAPLAASCLQKHPGSACYTALSEGRKGVQHSGVCVWLGVSSATTSPSLPVCAHGCWGFLNQIRVVVMGTGSDRGKEVMLRAC